jgi:hypothetical protein
MTSAYKEDPERPKRIKGALDDTAKCCYDLKEHHAEQAQKCGYAGDVLHSIAGQMEGVSDNPVVLGPAEQAINKFRRFVEIKKAQMGTVSFDVSDASYTIATSTTAAVSVAGFDDVRSAFVTIGLPQPPPWWQPDRITQYSRRLEKIDPEIGRLMRSVWESFYGTKENPERTALFAMRQLHDHLFAKLAPDDEVRKSNFFSEKKGPKPNEVRRKERIKYAANRKIPDKEWGATLEANADSLLATYERLNELHNRGPLDRNVALEVLTAMQASLEQWIDALNP